MRRCVFLFAISCATLSAQTITVVAGDWKASGINIVPGAGGNPNFIALASSVWQHKSLDATPLYPYSFILTNTTGRAIVAFSTRWLATDSDGRAITRDTQSTFGLFDGQHGQTGKSQLVTPITDLNGFGDTPSRLVPRLISAITQLQQTLVRKSSITITVESVVLDNGLLLGSDTNNGIAQLRADLDTRLELGTGVLNALSTGGQTAAVNYLQDRAMTAPQGDPLAASRQSSPELAYATFVSMFRQQLGRSLLATAQRDPAALERRATKLATQAVPALHR